MTLAPARACGEAAVVVPNAEAKAATCEAIKEEETPAESEAAPNVASRGPEPECGSWRQVASVTNRLFALLHAAATLTLFAVFLLPIAVPRLQGSQ